MKDYIVVICLIISMLLLVVAGIGKNRAIQQLQEEIDGLNEQICYIEKEIG